MPSRCSRAVRRADRRVLRRAGSSPSTLPSSMSQHRSGRCEWSPVMPRQVVEAEVVLGGRRVAPPRLQQARRRRRRRCPRSPSARRVVRRRSRSSVVLAPRVRHRQVAGQQVVERRDVGRALDAGVAAQRQDPAARAADVAEQQLEDRRGADVLHADACAGSSRPRSTNAVVRSRPEFASQRLGDLEERARAGCRRPRSTISGRVAREVPLEDLEDAARVLQRRSSRGAARRRAGAAVRAVRLLAAVSRLRARRPRDRVRALVLPASSGRRCRVSGSKPEKRPSRSSVSAEVLVDDRRPRWCRRRTYSRKSAVVARGRS